MRTGFSSRIITFWIANPGERDSVLPLQGVLPGWRVPPRGSAIKGRFKIDPADISDKMVPEIVPLPTVEVRSKVLHQSYTVRREIPFQARMKSMHNHERLLIKGPSHFPWGLSKGPEVHIPEVFHHDKEFSWVVADDAGYGNVQVVEKKARCRHSRCSPRARGCNGPGWPKHRGSIEV